MIYFKILENFYLTDAYGLNEPVLEDPNPIINVTRLGGKKPAVFLRLKLVKLVLEFYIFTIYLNIILDKTVTVVW